MRELTEEEQRIIRSYRVRIAAKYGRWIKELRAAGYTVESPGFAPEMVSEGVTRPPLTETQSALWDALKILPPGARGAQIRREGERIARREIPKGSAGTALKYLVIKGYAARVGDQYTAI